MYLLFFIWQFLLACVHPFYVSVTEINILPDKNEIQVTCKFFTDDLEEAIKAFAGTPVSLHQGDKNKLGKDLDLYISQHLKLRSTGKQIPVKFLGFENDQEATWCYFLGSGIGAIRDLEVFNDLLYETKKEQVNLLHVTRGGWRKSHRLTHPETRVNFQIESP